MAAHTACARHQPVMTAAPPAQSRIQPVTATPMTPDRVPASGWGVTAMQQCRVSLMFWYLATRVCGDDLVNQPQGTDPDRWCAQARLFPQSDVRMYHTLAALPHNLQVFLLPHLLCC